MADDRRDVHAWLEMLADLGAAHGTMHLACVLALHAVPRLGCFPSYATITAKSRLKKSAIAEHSGRLEAAGCLVVTPQRGEGRKQWNTYELTWPSDVEAARVAIVGRSHKAGSAGAEADRVPPVRTSDSAAAATGFRRGGARVPPVRKGKRREEKKEDKREEKASTFSLTRKIPRPTTDTRARGNFTGDDVLRLAPPCPCGRVRVLGWNGKPDEGEHVGSWYAYCPASCGADTFDPVHEGVAAGKAADDEQKRRAQERRRPPVLVPTGNPSVFRYPGRELDTPRAGEGIDLAALLAAAKGA